MRKVTAVSGLLLFAMSACGASPGLLNVRSPDGTIAVSFENGKDGLFWSMERKGARLVLPSRLGLDFAGEKWGAMKISAHRLRRADSTWENRFARRLAVRDRYCELEIALEETAAPNRRLGIEFRVFDEGAAFRYKVPEQPAFDAFQIREDLAEWRFAGNPECWAVSHKTHVNSQEGVYRKMTVGGLLPKDALFGMPLVVHPAGQAVAICEANLTNWAGMFFRYCPPRGDGTQGVRAELSPLPTLSGEPRGIAVIRKTPAESPWRVVMCADGDLELQNCREMLLNLNPPPEGDFSWVRPGACSWDWWVPEKYCQTTESEIRMVDFASEMGWPYHLIDAGWYGFSGLPCHGPEVEVESRRGFDLERVVSHAESRGIGVWVWVHWEALEGSGVDETVSRLSRMGVKGIKVDFMDRQDQWMVRWYEKVARVCARHRMMVNFHGAFKPTGTERTWPNVLTREGIYGNEGCKGGNMITPEHMATLPFTRFLLGPGDYTPGSFGNVRMKDFLCQYERGLVYGGGAEHPPVWAEEPGTRAHALALCVAFDSPLMTLCDWPERYRGAAGVEALRALPSVWKNTIPIDGAIGSHYAVARESFDGRFYFAAFTVEPRRVSLPLGFLPSGRWVATVYGDDAARSTSDARALAVRRLDVCRDDRVEFDLASEGGAVAVFEPQTAKKAPRP